MNPVVSPRGVVNALTQQPAPTTVAPGGLLTISGLNLGPAQGLKAEPGSWPMSLGGIEVTINGRPAPVGSVEPARITVQVPWEIQNGIAQIVVRRGEVSSRPARFFVQMPAPALGAAARNGSSVKVNASGLGMTEPRLTSGQAAAADPRSDIRVYAGGLPVGATAGASAARVGEFEIAFEAPEDARPGDLITVVANNRAANRIPLSRLSNPEMLFMPFPDGTPEIRSIMSADVRGTLVAAATARLENGCYTAWAFDLLKQQSTLFDECLIAAQRQMLTPFVSGNESPNIAALAGPPEGEPPNGVSSKVRILSATKAEPMTVELPAAAVSLNANAGGNFIANTGQAAGALEIDTETGDVRPLNQAGGALAGAINLLNLRLDLGDGVTTLLSPPVAVAQGILLVVAGDDGEKPTRAKLGVLNTRGEVTASRDFPAGWVPLIPPQPALPAGVQLPQGILRAAVNLQVDAASRALMVLSRKPDDSKHGIVRFSLADDEGAGAVEFPDGWFAATCSQRVPFLNIELARRFAIFGDRSSANQIRNPCPAQGFLVYDIDAQTAEAIPLPGQGQMNAAGSADEINDFVYATNIDPSRQGRADTVFVLDAVTLSPFRFDPPPEINVVQNLTPVRDMNLLIGQAGNAGFVIFDVESMQTRVLPTPDGFTNMQLLGVFTTTKKVVARGNRADGSRLLIYNLETGDLEMPPNPPGVAYIGPPQVQAANPGGGGQGPGQPGPGPGQNFQPQQQLQVIGLRANARANTVEAIAYNSDRQQTGIVVLRVP